jgi:hypothetical protein
VSAENAKQAADLWISRQDLAADLRGRVVQLVVFGSEQDCRFFYPRRAIEWQQQVNTYISRNCRGRKAKIQRVTLTPAMYDEWRGRERRDDNEEARREFADSFQKLIEAAT